MWKKKLYKIFDENFIKKVTVVTICPLTEINIFWYNRVNLKLGKLGGQTNGKICET